METYEQQGLTITLEKQGEDAVVIQKRIFNDRHERTRKDEVKFVVHADGTSEVTHGPLPYLILLGIPMRQEQFRKIVLGSKMHPYESLKQFFEAKSLRKKVLKS